MRSGPDWFILLETIGILSFAFNAMIVAKAKGLSPIGIFICAAVTALGGGTLRDLLLGPSALPFFWIAFPFYIVAIFFLSLAYAHLEVFRDIISRRVLAIKDVAETAAMASLAALGAAKAYTILAPGVQPGLLGAMHLIILCAFFGAMTASFGGIIRDILLNEFPTALKPDSGLIELLFVGSLAVVLLRMADVPQPWALLAGFATIVILRTWRLSAVAKKA
jgi:uncharacterized membrane protein YeiH